MVPIIPGLSTLMSGLSGSGTASQTVGPTAQETGRNFINVGAALNGASEIIQSIFNSGSTVNGGFPINPGYNTFQTWPTQTPQAIIPTATPLPNWLLPTSAIAIGLLLAFFILK